VKNSHSTAEIDEPHQVYVPGPGCVPTPGVTQLESKGSVGLYRRNGNSNKLLQNSHAGLACQLQESAVNCRIRFVSAAHDCELQVTACNDFGEYLHLGGEGTPLRGESEKLSVTSHQKLRMGRVGSIVGIVVTDGCAGPECGLLDGHDAFKNAIDVDAASSLACTRPYLDVLVLPLLE
jgi:hypothetical protein